MLASVAPPSVRRPPRRRQLIVATRCSAARSAPSPRRPPPRSSSAPAATTRTVRCLYSSVRVAPRLCLSGRVGLGGEARRGAARRGLPDPRGFGASRVDAARCRGGGWRYSSSLLAALLAGRLAGGRAATSRTCCSPGRRFPSASGARAPCACDGRGADGFWARTAVPLRASAHANPGLPPASLASPPRAPRRIASRQLSPPEQSARPLRRPSL